MINITRPELIDKYAKFFNVQKNYAEQAINDWSEFTKDILLSGETIVLRDCYEMGLRKCGARRAGQLHGDGVVEIPSKIKPYVKFGKGLKQSINAKYNGVE